jgi:hypothetical protein
MILRTLSGFMEKHDLMWQMNVANVAVILKANRRVSMLGQKAGEVNDNSGGIA